jgi:NAD(P)-dependent dehydrogenase (short-subunit alcohol dehydrogenase family)
LYPEVDVHPRQFDAADEAAVKAVIDEALARYGRLDIMFANAGVVGTNRSFLDIDSEEFMNTMRTNVLRLNPRIFIVYQPGGEGVRERFTDM